MTLSKTFRRSPWSPPLPMSFRSSGYTVDLHCARTWVAVLTLFLGAAQTAAADGLRAGQWRTVNSPEIDGVAGPVQQTIRCLTPEAVADLDKTFSPISRTTNSTCERVEHESTPQRLKWRLQCT